MPRIAKADVNQALALAAQTINEAGGANGRISRAEIKAKLQTLPPELRGLVDVFYRFIDHRDARPGAQVTKSDVDAAVAYAKDALIARYDLNDNGLSAAEIARMSETGKAAVALARALKQADVPPAPPRVEEGLSEPDEILAAGQVPRDWTPAVALTSGSALHQGDTFTGLQTTVPMSAEQQEVATAALTLLWDRVIKYRANGSNDPVELGQNRAGVLKLGPFTRPDDGKTYLVADWQDIDDGSFTLYFERRSNGDLRLAIDQFNN